MSKLGVAERDRKYAMIEMFEKRIVEVMAMNEGPWIFSPASVRRTPTGK
ncbi:MAG: hypothetical protein LLG01_15195 [Planctomycetaceae bacterium]|nr:hypothetical protein [Planctomycetaceae bacterium]